MIREAVIEDIAVVEQTYRNLLIYEKKHGSNSNWVLDLYPTRATAEKALQERSLYVLVDKNEICGSIILNRLQPPEYQKIDWQYPADASRVLVIHTLCIPPEQAGKGYGGEMVRYAIQKAEETGCEVIRLDTWAGNKPAAALYQKMGFRFAGTTNILLQGLIPEEQVFFEMGLDEIMTE